MNAFKVASIVELIRPFADSFGRRSGSLVVGGVILLGWVSVSTGQEKVTFDDHVKPIFNQRCASCHNPSKRNGDLDVTNFTNLMLGGGSGSVIEPGDVGASYLFALVNHDDEPAMPPDSPKMPEAEIGVIRQWIELGALENQNSKARLMTGPKVAALDASPLERPEKVAVPALIPLEPALVPSRPNALMAVDTSPWAALAALGGPEQVQLYSMESRDLVGILPFPEGTLNVVRFSRNGSLVMGAGGRPGAAGVVAVWDVVTGDRLMTVDEESDAILAADLSPDQASVAVGGPQRLVRVYSTENEDLRFEIKKHTEWVTAVAFSPDGVLLATADRNGGLHVWESFTGREYLTLGGHGAAITSLSWRADSNVLSSASEDGTIKLWEMENGGEVRGWGAHGGGVLNHEFTRDGRIVSTGRDRVGKLWDQAGKQLVQVGGLTDIGTGITHCDETNRILVCDWAGNALVFAADGTQVGPVEVTPVTLQQRITAAEQALNEVKSRHAPEAKAKADLEAEVSRLSGLVEQAKSAIATMTSDKNSVSDFIAKATQDLAATSEQMSKLAQQQAVLAKELPSLEAALKSLKAAAEVGGDEGIKQQSAGVTELVTAKRSSAQELEKTLVTLSATKKQLDDGLAVSKVTQTELETGLAAKTQQLGELEPQLAKVIDAAKAKAELVSALDQELALAMAEVERWQNQSRLVSQLSTNREAYREVEQDIESVFENKEALEAEVSKAEAGVAESTAAVAKAAADLETLKSRMAEVQAGKVASEKSITEVRSGIETGKAKQTSLTSGIDSLKTAVTSTKAALELAGDDQPLAEAVTQLEMLVGAKQKELEGVQKQLADDDASLAQMQKTLETQTADLTALMKNVSLAEAAHVQATERLQQLMASRDELQAKATAVEQELERLTAELQRLDAEKLELQGVSSDAA